MRIHPVQAGFVLVGDVNVSPICGICNHSLDKDNRASAVTHTKRIDPALALGLFSPDAGIVLHGASGVMAVYRARQVKEDYLMLRRMKRWPGSIEK